MKFYTDGHGSKTMNPNDFGDSLTLHSMLLADFIAYELKFSSVRGRMCFYLF